MVTTLFRKKEKNGRVRGREEREEERSSGRKEGKEKEEGREAGRGERKKYSFLSPWEMLHVYVNSHAVFFVWQPFEALWCLPSSRDKPALLGVRAVTILPKQVSNGGGSPVGRVCGLTKSQTCWGWQLREVSVLLLIHCGLGVKQQDVMFSAIGKEGQRWKLSFRERGLFTAGIRERARAISLDSVSDTKPLRSLFTCGELGWGVGSGALAVVAQGTELCSSLSSLTGVDTASESLSVFRIHATRRAGGPPFPVLEVHCVETILPLAFLIQKQTCPCEGWSKQTGRKKHKLGMVSSGLFYGLMEVEQFCSKI